MSQKPENNEGVLARWSRRKLQQVDDSADNEAKKRLSELKSEHEPKVDLEQERVLPIWQQDDVDSETKQKALAALFRQAEFQDVDHMNEYDEDFTQFDPLGDIITQEMKRMITLAEEKTRPRQSEITEHDNDIIASESAETDGEDNNEEDKDLA